MKKRKSSLQNDRFSPPIREANVKSSGSRSMARLVDPTGKFNVARIGLHHSKLTDLYHWLLVLPWLSFLALVGLSYVAANTFFALLYLLQPGSINNADSFEDAFFFSVQTMATIGYGVMSPHTLYANVIVAIEALIGLLGVAMATGLMFARFARPTARVLFSKVAVVTPIDGIPTLMFRTANQRANQIIEAQMRLTLVRNVQDAKGSWMRRFYDLELVRSRSPIFVLTWTAMHPIDEASPLYGMTTSELEDVEAEIVVTLTGIDETFAQPIHARHSYIPNEILWNMRFADILDRTPEGKRAVNYTRFHDIFPTDY